MRATDLPDKWQLLLDALDNNDFKKAREICTRYKFGQGKSNENFKRRKKYLFQTEAPKGEIRVTSSIKEVSEISGIKITAIYQKFSTSPFDEIEWTQGKNSGWKVRRLPK